MLSEGACTWLGSVAARDQLALAISQGLPYGDEPVVGGVICWWSANNGHCAVIEEVIDANTVRTSESGWNYTTPPVVTDNIRYRSGGAWQLPWTGYTYPGIIYPPAPHVTTDPEDYYMLWLQEETLWK